MSARLRNALFFAASILAGAFLAIAALSPGSSEERFREHHRDHDGDGGAGVNLGITLGTELLQRRAKKPGAPGTSTVKSPPAKKGDKKDEAKKKEKPKAPPAEKPKEETDCILYMHYTQDREPPAASNEDIKKSAEALQKKLAKDAKKEPKEIPMEEVNSATTIDKALDKIGKKGKCCKTLHIVAHGADGALDLPYDLPDKKGELAKKDKADGAQHWIGGKPAKAGWGGDRLTELVKKLKQHLCKDGSVVFDSCWAGAEGSIAEQVAGQGIPTKGFPGYCEMGPQVDKDNPKDKLYSPPRPGTGEHQSDPPKSFAPKGSKPEPSEEPQKE